MKEGGVKGKGGGDKRESEEMWNEPVVLRKDAS